jgi:hypothetical protein
VFVMLDGIVLQQTLFGDAAETEAVVERLRDLLRSAGARVQPAEGAEQVAPVGR